MNPIEKVSLEYHDTAISKKSKEIANLRADLDQARRDRNSAVECAEVLRGYVAEHKAALSAARAALDGERDHANAARRCVVVHDGRETGTDATAFYKWRQTHDQRRAADSKEPK